MEQFVYSDIFDTKGIEYIIVIFFFLLMIPFWRMLNRPVKMKETLGDVIRAINLQALRVPQGLLFNRNHTWSHLEPSGVASVGMDDLLLHLTGGVELSYLKERQERVKRGEPIARITQEGKELVITSPISGEIDRVHSSLEENSGAIIDDPYSSWLYRIRPEKWREETSDAMMAEKASEWTGKELERFKDYLAEIAAEVPGSGLVLQEGGELTSYPLREMDQKVWTGFQEKFLGMEG
jgi:glycine cleavage system H protein